MRSPNQEPDGSPRRSTARHHGDFDDDLPTLQATLARILGRKGVKAKFAFHRSASSLRDRRMGVDRAVGTRRPLE